jgi:hypothetical protein
MSKVTNEAVDDILTTALEGGSNYWLPEYEVIGGIPDVDSTLIPGHKPWESECLTKGRTIRCVEDCGEGDDPVEHVLTLEMMQAGIERAAEHWGQSVEAFHEGHDIEGADVALQFGLLGEIRYG